MASEKCGRFLRSRQAFESDRDKASAMAARRVHESMERELKKICKGRLRTGREIHFMDAMGSSFVTIDTDKQQYIISGDGFYRTAKNSSWLSAERPVLKEISALVEEYNWASNNDFAINDVRFIT